MPRASDLSGCRFGRLLVLNRNSVQVRKGQVSWVCACDCGKVVDHPTSSSLNSGNTTSCGCFAREQLANRNYKHGGSKRSEISREYRSWLHMKSRCLNNKDKSFNNYGARGIKICDRWLNSFENFLHDMGECPDGFELDRVDFNGDYEPSNCRWTTESIQSWNQRRQSNNTSGKEGVKFVEGGWVAEISIDNNRIYLGYHKDFLEAVKVREIAEIEYYGEVKNEFGPKT